MCSRRAGGDPPYNFSVLRRAFSYAKAVADRTAGPEAPPYIFSTGFWWVVGSERAFLGGWFVVTFLGNHAIWRRLLWLILLLFRWGRLRMFR